MPHNKLSPTFYLPPAQHEDWAAYQELCRMKRTTASKQIAKFIASEIELNAANIRVIKANRAAIIKAIRNDQ